MNKYFLIAIFAFGIVATGLAQNLNSFKYVKVPEEFEFLKEENQYDLNALTAFLFGKYNFRVLYKRDVPKGTDPCEILQANVHSKSGLFRSRLYVTLENCRNEVVFTSKTGTSREKDFGTSYHEALREAFTSVEQLNYNFEAAERVASAEKQSKELPGEIIVDPVVTAEEIEAETSEKPTSEGVSGDSGSSEIREFTNGSQIYTLKETSSGFELYKQGEVEKFATLMKSGGGAHYLYASKNISGNAFFDTHGNLVVEYLEPNSGQVITINYKLRAQ